MNNEGGSVMTDVQVTMRDIPNSTAIESTIRTKAEKLNKFYDRILKCTVVIELPQKRKHQGKIYNVRIDLKVPGRQLVCTHKFDQDIYVAIRDAFNAIGKQLEEFARKRHGRTKTHTDVLRGHVTRLVPIEGYGFIEGWDGNEYYFSITNVTHPRFDNLSIGDAVQFTSESGNEGRQAHHVVLEHKNHEAA
jgi:ribosomal subunit interface protein